MRFRKTTLAACCALIVLTGIGGSVAAFTAGMSEPAQVSRPAVRSGAQLQHSPFSHTAPDNVMAAHRMVTAVNNYRTLRGRPPLTWSQGAATAAGYQADYNVREGGLSHQSSTGETAVTSLARAGVSWNFWGENLARGNLNAEVIVDAWDASERHRGILLGDYTRIGVGLRFSMHGEPVWSLILYR